MCRYSDNKADKTIQCSLEKYYALAEGIDHKLPLDNQGFCIFHSQNLAWKVENGFSDKLNGLFDLITALANEEIPFDFKYGFKNFDCKGIHFVGAVTKLLDDSIHQRLIIENLSIKKDSTYITFDESHFYHVTNLQQCDFTKTDLSFKNCIFEQDLNFSNLSIRQLSLFGAELKGGFNSNKCEFQSYCEFCDLKVQQTFNIMSTDFFGATFFTESHFSTDAWNIDDAYFEDLVDFSECVFDTEMSIENCTFASELRFTNGQFKRSAIFQFNEYKGSVFFNSKDVNQKLFDDYVYFKLAKIEDLSGQIIFENANFSNIVNEDRETLMVLAKSNKVTIGKGCIKYRVQTKPIKIKINHAHHNLITELTNSFSSYFLYSNGFNLGVEFTNKQLHAIELFYFTDEDISLEELYHRLGACEEHFWTFSMDKNTLTKNKDLIHIIDSYVSKLSILSKIGFRSDYGLWNDEDTEALLKTITYTTSSISLDKINIFIDKLKLTTENNMTIKKLLIEGGQQQFADKIVNNDAAKFS